MTLAILLVPGAYARVPDALFELDISELANLPVVTASRHEQALWQAPAVMVVLEGEALRRRGYQSLAEALAWVPGFHVIDDGVGQYAVVRGVGGGQRAYGRTLKVMLDGQPLGIRSDATQFLGPELLPLGLVERVEIVRGPASALYGADAYLGVINIITRRDAATRVQLGAGREHKGGSAAAEVLATAAPADGEWQATVAALQARHDRSGRQLPDSSPQPPATTAFSQNDESRPLSFYARVSREQAAQRHSLVLHASERDTDAEFLDFGRLSHDNRVALAQQTLSWESAFGEPGQSGSTLWRLAYAWGGPSEDERLSQGVPGSHPARDFGYRSWELAVEQQYRLERQHLVVGVDGSWDHEAPFEVFSVNNVTGDRIQLTPAEEERLFRNVGVYLQSQWQPWQERDWTLSLNW
ncbi:MAG: TonB-dependent receptor plug domain-containing protein, partial [Moraxellaceae bacterium]|nr:TonB-dependent receptor plug domain-containing protein [Moraxellaceae bacterium]